MSGLTKQAACLTDNQLRNAIARTNDYRNRLRNKAIVELTALAGLRAVEVSRLRWSMLLSEDNAVSETIRLTNAASKGKSGGLVPVNRELKATLTELLNSVKTESFDRDSNVIVSERGCALQRQSIVNLLRNHYKKCDIAGASSHSGRKFFITNAARSISLVGGSIKDIQALARHANLQNTQRYIEQNTEAQKQVVEMLLK